MGFPTGTGIKYHPGTGLLVVRNTADNFRKLDNVISYIDMTPTMMRIDAELLEVSGEFAKNTLTSREIRSLPPSQRQTIGRLASLAMDGQTSVVKSADSRMTVTPHSGSDGYTIGIALDWRHGQDRIQTQLRLWDGESIIIPVATEGERETLLVISANIVNPAGLPIWTNDP